MSWGISPLPCQTKMLLNHLIIGSLGEPFPTTFKVVTKKAYKTQQKNHIFGNKFTQHLKCTNRQNLKNWLSTLFLNSGVFSFLRDCYSGLFWVEGEYSFKNQSCWEEIFWDQSPLVNCHREQSWDLDPPYPP